MTVVATHQPLFFAPPDPHKLFEKVAAVSKMTDDEKKWPAQIISELHRQLPYLSKYSVDLDLSRIEPEAGYGLGYAMVVNKSLQHSPTDQISQPKNRIRIPVIIKDRMLQPFHVFEVGGTVYPLTQERIDAAMFNPDVFDGVAATVPTSPSLIDQLYPPYQQRQGFGRVGGDSDLPAMGKSGSAPNALEEYFASAGRMKKEAEAEKEAKLPAALRGFHNKENEVRAPMPVDPADSSAGGKAQRLVNTPEVQKKLKKAQLGKMQAENIAKARARGGVRGALSEAAEQVIARGGVLGVTSKKVEGKSTGLRAALARITKNVV